MRGCKTKACCGTAQKPALELHNSNPYSLHAGWIHFTGNQIISFFLLVFNFAIVFVITKIKSHKISTVYEFCKVLLSASIG